MENEERNDVTGFTGMDDGPNDKWTSRLVGCIGRRIKF